jgi:hypothetical protein
VGVRSPSADEERLLRALGRIARLQDLEHWLQSLRVEPMDDGGMGSLRFPRPPSADPSPGVVVRLSCVQFQDVDGVDVVASLNARSDGILIELDVWKTDFSPLIKIPDSASFAPCDDT